MSDVATILAKLDELGRGVMLTKADTVELSRALLAPVDGDGNTRADRMADLPRQVRALDARLARIEALLAERA